jgi:glycosyltransferase involved in cell wall biosynthesis
MIKLSAVIITYNEERNIGHCLDSLHPVADEILVVDSFSTDKTKEICLQRGVRFLENRFAGHIEQKNYALAQTTYDHVLSLDADEVLSPELTRSILQVKQRWSYDGYSMNRLSSYCGKWIRHCGWYPDRKLRLWNRTKGQWGGSNPHDRVMLDQNARQAHLPGDLLHYTYYTISQHLQQIDFFTEIMSREAYKNGKRSSLLKLLLSPVVKFIKDYFIKLGFLDGYYGFVISTVSAFATYCKHLKIREHYKNRDATTE